MYWHKPMELTPHRSCSCNSKMCATTILGPRQQDRRAAGNALLRVPKAAWAQPAYDNNLPNLGRLRVYINREAAQDERWLVLHDSFGEWLSLIMPALAGTSCFLHNPDFDEIFVRKFRPTRVFFIQVERFFIRAPLNGVDYAELFAEQARLKGSVTAEIPPEITARLFSREAPGRTGNWSRGSHTALIKLSFDVDWLIP